MVQELLKATEYNLLAELSIHAGPMVPYDDLLRLGRKLGEDAENPVYVFAEPRVGYRMVGGRQRTAGSKEYQLLHE